MAQAKRRKPLDLEGCTSGRRSAIRNPTPQTWHGQIAQACGVRLIRYLIDTNLVSELRKPKPYGAAVAWLQSLELGQGFFSAVTFGEIRNGLGLTRRQDRVKANELAAWAAQLERTSQVLSMDATWFREYARLNQ